MIVITMFRRKNHQSRLDLEDAARVETLIVVDPVEVKWNLEMLISQSQWVLFPVAFNSLEKRRKNRQNQILEMMVRDLCVLFLVNSKRYLFIDEDSQSPKPLIDGSNTSSESEEERPTMSSMAGFRTKANTSSKGRQMLLAQNFTGSKFIFFFIIETNSSQF